MCQLLEDMATRLEGAVPSANLQLNCAKYFKGRSVIPGFFRMMDDPHKRGAGTMEPIGTLFSIHLDVTNTGRQSTTVKELWADVVIQQATLPLSERRSGGQIYCKKSNFFPAEDGLKQGERVTIGSGAVETVHLCLVTPENVPMGIDTVSGTVRCEDVLGNAVHVVCTFVQEG